MNNFDLQIERSSNNRFCLLYKGGEIDQIKNLGDDFYKIDRLYKKSNYWRLWPNDSCFYLWFHSPSLFGFVGGGIPWCFVSISYYSEITGSFVAHKSDSNYVYLLYEDSPNVINTSLEIGEESDDEFRSRPVKYNYKGIRWCYFETTKQRLAWRKEVGYKLSDGWSLKKRFCKGYYTTHYKNDNYDRLAFYSQGKGCFYFDNESYKFTSIKKCGRFLVCASLNHIFYVFDTSRQKRRHLCSSRVEPKCFAGSIVISNGETWRIVNTTREEIVSNYNWNRSKELCICDKYVFCQNGENGTWKLYRLENGYEIYLDWQNINIENTNEEAPKLLVDIDGRKQIEKSISDIEEAHEQWKERLCASFPHSDAKVPENIPNSAVMPKTDLEETVANDLKTTQERVIETKPIAKSTPIPTNVVLPDSIDYIISIKNVRLYDTGFINCDRKSNIFSFNDIILWYDSTKRIIYISKYRRSKTYKILYTILELPKDVDFSNLPGQFERADLFGITEEGDLISKLTELNRTIEHNKAKAHTECKRTPIERGRTYIEHSRPCKEESIVDEKSKMTKISFFLQGLGYGRDAVRAALQALCPDKKIVGILDSPKVEFLYNDKLFKLSVDERWNTEDPFYNQVYLKKNKYIAVLISERNFKELAKRSTYYDYWLIGQGTDKRFSQDFNPVNSEIWNNKKEVYLFRKIDNAYYFFDKVKSVSYEMVEDETDLKYYPRKLIRFNMQSLIRKVR